MTSWSHDYDTIPSFLICVSFDSVLVCGGLSLEAVTITTDAGCSFTGEGGVGGGRDLMCGTLDVVCLTLREPGCPGCFDGLFRNSKRDSSLGVGSFVLEGVKEEECGLGCSVGVVETVLAFFKGGVGFVDVGFATSFAPDKLPINCCATFVPLSASGSWAVGS